MVWGDFSLPCGPGVPGPQGHHCATPQGHPTYLRLLPRPPPAPLLRRVLLPLGGQGLAGFGAGFAHRPFCSGEEEREEEGQSALGAHAGAAPRPPPRGLQLHPSRGCSCTSQRHWAAERTGYQAGSCPSPTESAHVLVLGQPPGSPAGVWGVRPRQPFPQSPAPCPETRRAGPDLIWSPVNPRHAAGTGKLEQDRRWHRIGAPAPSTAAPQPCSCRPAGFRDSSTWHLSQGHQVVPSPLRVLKGWMRFLTHGEIPPEERLHLPLSPSTLPQQRRGNPASPEPRGWFHRQLQP